MRHVAIVDYQLGNLFSVQRACAVTGLDARITSDKKEVLKADGIILPGVGAFGDAMDILRKQDLLSPLRESINSGKPFLGICLGMQLLMDESEEFGLHAGLGVFAGKVVQFPHVNNTGERMKVPQVGWNALLRHGDAWGTPLLDGIENGAQMYFVHSFYVIPVLQDIVVATSVYEGVSYASGIAKNNITAFQFHPEKSGTGGLQIYKNFARMVDAY